MDRRSFLRRKKTQHKTAVLETSRTQTGLDPYAGPWDRTQAAHLLRRTLFGPKESEIQWATNAGLAQTVNQLMAPSPLPAPPINYYFENDPNVPIGATWIHASGHTGLNYYRKISLLAWNIGLMLNQPISLREKMTLFWHNHFAIEMNAVNDARFIYRYNTLLRTHALGNFQTLAEEITVDPTMLRYLNGNQNVSSSPNENYARELFELFTVGKGPLIGPGDYTHYTEDDVRAASRVLTGWRDRGYGNSQGPIRIQFRANRHDTGSKQFSDAFGNHVITDKGESEYLDLIQMIFNQAETARYICRKLYRWFVYYEIDTATEQNVIEPMSQLLQSSNFDVVPVLTALFSSEHFYDANNIGCMIKNPIDYSVGIMRQLEVEFPDEFNPNAQYRHWLKIHTYAKEQLLDLFNPPGVAGWPAYYQLPTYHQAWISSVTLPARAKMASYYNVGKGYNSAGFRSLIQPLELINFVSNPLNPNAVVEEFSRLLFPQPIDQSQKDFLKDVLIPGLPDYEWLLEYGDFLSSPNDTNLRNAVNNKLRNLLETMMNMAEFHLS